MNKKENKKKLKILIAICIIIIIIVIIIIMILKDRNSVNEYLEGEERVNEETSQLEEYLEGKVVPQGISSFVSEYGGSYDRNEFYEDLYVATEYIPDLAKDLENQDINEYYSENSSIIENYLGITEESDFESLSNYIMNNELADATLDYCIYNSGSMVENDGYWDFTMIFIYEGYDELEFNVSLRNEKSYLHSNLVILAPNE